MALRLVALVLCVLFFHVDMARASLDFSLETTSDGTRYVMISGTFDSSDSLGAFTRLVRSHNPAIVSFNSDGGSVIKAMELGRLIRSYGLRTVQVRGPECSSACSLAFLGGTSRYAEPGSIGVHRASYNFGHRLSTDQAVSSIQELTALVMQYMIEMGVDPALLQLALQYDKNDMRYLSGSEMERFNVVTFADRRPSKSASSGGTASYQPVPRRASGIDLSIPVPGTGKVRHVNGEASLKAEPLKDAATIISLKNGKPVKILESAGGWYRIEVAGVQGFMRNIWVSVDQFENAAATGRRIQIKSEEKLEDALDFVRGNALELDVFLASNGWFAITLQGEFDPTRGATLLKMLKDLKSVPRDAFMTYGNAYVRKICCE